MDRNICTYSGDPFNENRIGSILRFLTGLSSLTRWSASLKPKHSGGLIFRMELKGPSVLSSTCRAFIASRIHFAAAGACLLLAPLSTMSRPIIMPAPRTSPTNLKSWTPASSGLSDISLGLSTCFENENQKGLAAHLLQVLQFL